MRVPLMPLALSLAVGGLLYAAYQGNKRLVDAAALRPAVTAPAAPAGATGASGEEAPESPMMDADVPLDPPDLDERCAALAATASAAAEALDAGTPYDQFIRRPVVAFVDDPALRTELEAAARAIYAAPPASPTIGRHETLQRARCF